MPTPRSKPSRMRVAGHQHAQQREPEIWMRKRGSMRVHSCGRAAAGSGAVALRTSVSENPEGLVRRAAASTRSLRLRVRRRRRRPASSGPWRILLLQHVDPHGEQQHVNDAEHQDRAEHLIRADHLAAGQALVRPRKMSPLPACMWRSCCPSASVPGHDRIDDERLPARLGGHPAGLVGEVRPDDGDDEDRHEPAFLEQRAAPEEEQRQQRQADEGRPRPTMR